jgi:hypothetical protein
MRLPALCRQALWRQALWRQALWRQALWRQPLWRQPLWRQAPWRQALPGLAAPPPCASPPALARPPHPLFSLPFLPSFSPFLALPRWLTDNEHLAKAADDPSQLDPDSVIAGGVR